MLFVLAGWITSLALCPKSGPTISSVSVACAVAVRLFRSESSDWRCRLYQSASSGFHSSSLHRLPRFVPLAVRWLVFVDSSNCFCLSFHSARRR
uniref:Putative secreted protein n=1 Tax=Anopheles darlingi TaxID=43151 RepID=A0A2M4D9I3_ANODA